MRNTILLYTSNLKQLELLSDAQAGQLFRAVLAYGQNGTASELDPATAVAFSFMAEQIDRSNAEYDAKCEARREAARLAGIASGKTRRKQQTEADGESPERTLTNVNEGERQEHKHKINPNPNPKLKIDDDINKEIQYIARARAYANGQLAPHLPAGMSEEEAQERLREMFGRYFMADPQTEGRLIEIMHETSLGVTLKAILRAVSYNATHPLRYIQATARSLHEAEEAGILSEWPEEPPAILEKKRP